MENLLETLVVVACFAVLAIVAVGVTVFARGGEANRKWANKIMQLRVAAQFVAVLLIVALAWTMSDG
jgi:hypothetical protein